ncbi:hypothetical protein KFZ56_13370 [Virgibacillus sp. NKC19-3]|uniref:hypothetical protein n=1 Tax=Virgibacillus saliphilus TaxID=2831674 RepID=UPI001C9AB9E0|nr:hypothetical protein [Virgibacillus sp. NKC19-3]MBY7144017.1 hypothetical protein [Virgibacillus sp. NKC19-3]
MEGKNTVVGKRSLLIGYWESEQNVPVLSQVLLEEKKDIVNDKAKKLQWLVIV